MSMAPLIAFQNVGKWYGTHKVLDDVCLGVAKDETVVVCGPSGSGKSTLVFLVNGLERYEEGSVRVDGVEVNEADGTAHHMRRHIGMVFQSFNLFPHLTILENCTLAPRKVLSMDRAEAEARALDELARVRIADQALKYPDKLSGGQQQRVAIVRALCMAPEILLFDEPTSALDPEMVGDVLSVMAELTERGITIICITHEMGFTRRVADRVVMLEAGRIVEDAPTEAFFDQGQANPRVRAFLDQLMHV